MVALKVLSILVLVMVHVLDAALIPCVWTQFRLKILNEESIELLNSMGDLLPLKCLEKGWRALPDDAFFKVQDEDLAMVSLEVLRGVERIFKDEPTTVTWDKEKLGLFRNVISYRQVENLQKCVSVSNCENTFGIVWKYGFSECSWEMARDKVTNVLMKFQAFLESRK
ncbi:hypothetical protein AMEX_G4544 [Astyanax mexicanus]|uniref:Uncharacterized protein n=2 Tax=Astyanax mexicanus TaxID=7994 RepID=A0A8T2MB77_ASTMX|nr:hypothetical protein AMEX_G4544 [Astyanax mexicanus]